MFKPLKEDSIYARLVNESRYINMTIMFVVQSALSVPSPIRQGASLVFCKRVNDKNEARTLNEILNLSTENQKEYLLKIKVADTIFVNKEKGAVPISIINPPYPVRHVTEDEILSHQSDQLIKILGNVSRENQKKNNEEPLNDKPKSGSEEFDYNMILVIYDLLNFPFDFQSERAIRLNLNKSILSATLSKLIEFGFIQKHTTKINLGKGKSPYQHYMFTEKGINKFGKQKIHGKGSLEHAFWQNRCKKYYDRISYETKIEYYLADGHSSIDLVVLRDEEKIAIEIELNETDHIQDNILKCINEDFNQIIVAVYSLKLAKYVKRTLLNHPVIEENYREKRVALKMLSEFLD